ncbi:IclR family transcriptional regulator [Aquabacterium sp.]|uniref:IclR family transcriptional regulator n=1 Tax=Aquabacterium sp. TaxID=1872578 RepID=UPI003BB18961
MSDSPTPTTSVQVMSRMFALLDVLAREGQAVSLKVASERTGLHPSTAHRILNDLASGGLVERSGPGHYRLGMRLLTLGNLVKSRLDVREQAGRPMQELHRLSGHVVSLFVRQDDEAVCVERTVAERHGIQLTRADGLRTPLTRSAAGKILLLDDGGLLLQALCQLQADSLESLQRELSTIRTQGIALHHDALGVGQHMAAAPVRNDQGQVVASLTLSWQGGDLRSEWVDALKAAAQNVSAALGWAAVE